MKRSRPLLMRIRRIVWNYLGWIQESSVKYEIVVTEKSGNKRSVTLIGFDLSCADKRLSPVEIVPYEDKYFDACLNIYRLNDTNGRFPDSYTDRFADHLRNPESLKLVAIRKREIVGTGAIGITKQGASVWACLSFGLVSPAHHGTGLGTALLLGRLAYLERSYLLWHLTLSPVKTSASFYASYGFTHLVDWNDDLGNTFQNYCSILTGRQILSIQRLLSYHDVLLPANLVIPKKVIDESDPEKFKLIC